MRKLIVFLLFLVISVWLGVQVMRHPGYLLIVYHHWLIQMPIWFVLLSLFFIFSIFYLIIVSIDHCQFLWFRLKNWLRIRNEHKSYSKTQHGLCLLIEGRYKKAEQFLLSGAKQSHDPFINYVAAAKAAFEQNAYDKSDLYIKKAYALAPDAHIAIGIVQAELQLKQHALEQAVATLSHLKQQSKRHPRVLKLLETAYVRLGDWKNLQKLLPDLAKAKVLTQEQTEQFEANLYEELFRLLSHKSLTEVRGLWETIPRHMKKNPQVVTAYVKQLARHAPITGEETTKEMEELIRKTLKHSWQPELVLIYSALPFASLNRQLVIAGAWLKMYGPHQESLLLLGKLCVRLQLWGKAKDYFDKCLTLGPSLEASLEYGKLLENLGDQEEALRKYRQGLMQLKDPINMMSI